MNRSGWWSCSRLGRGHEYSLLPALVGDVLSGVAGLAGDRAGLIAGFVLCGAGGLACGVLHFLGRALCCLLGAFLQVLRGLECGLFHGFQGFSPLFHKAGGGLLFALRGWQQGGGQHPGTEGDQAGCQRMPLCLSDGLFGRLPDRFTGLLGRVAGGAGGLSSAFLQGNRPLTARCRRGCVRYLRRSP